MSRAKLWLGCQRRDVGRLYCRSWERARSRHNMYQLDEWSCEAYQSSVLPVNSFPSFGLRERKEQQRVLSNNFKNTLCGFAQVSLPLPPERRMLLRVTKSFWTKWLYVSAYAFSNSNDNPSNNNNPNKDTPFQTLLRVQCSLFSFQTYRHRKNKYTSSQSTGQICVGRSEKIVHRLEGNIKRVSQPHQKPKLTDLRVSIVHQASGAIELRSPFSRRDTIGRVWQSNVLNIVHDESPGSVGLEMIVRKYWLCYKLYVQDSSRSVLVLYIMKIFKIICSIMKLGWCPLLITCFSSLILSYLAWRLLHQKAYKGWLRIEAYERLKR